MAVTDMISGVAGAVSALTTSIAAPLMADAEAQKYEKQYTNDLSEIQSAFAETDPQRRADLLAAVAERLCTAGGFPFSGNLGNQVCDVPVAALLSLLCLAAGFRRSTAYQAQLLHKAVS